MIIRLFIIVSFLSLNSLSGFSNDSLINNVFGLIYNQQFDKAQSLLISHKNQMDSFYADVLHADLLWWKYSTSRSRKDSKNLKILLGKIYTNGEDTKENQIRELIKKSYLLRYERKRYNLFGIIRIRSEINNLLNELNKEKIPLKGKKLKLFELYISMFKYFDNINPFSIQKKSKERLKPLQNMEEFALEDDLIISTMAHYFLGRIYQKIEKQPQKGKNHFEFLTNKYPENKLFFEYKEDCEEKLLVP